MKKRFDFTSKLTAIVLCIVLAASPVLSACAAERGKLGDINSDDVVSIGDVTLIQQYIAQMISFDKKEEAAADIDGNGEINILDADELQRSVANYDSEYPVDENLKPYEDEKNKAVNALEQRLDSIGGGNAPKLMRSYDTDKVELSSAAYTYDNAIAAMAFLSAGKSDKAQVILDSFVYAVNNDRFLTGKIRNAYRAGVISPQNSSEKGTLLPGWWDDRYGWCEDSTQVGCNTGNTAFAVLAMLQYDKINNTDRYLETTETLMDWVLEDCTDGGLGFTAGFIGWPENGEDSVTRLTYKATEHQVDLYPVFCQLYSVTGKEKYKNAADSALAFIKSMYNTDGGYFYTGTDADGITPNKSVVVLDAQVWNALSLGSEFEPYSSALDLVKEMKTAEGAYPFCLGNKNGGFWCEGTAFTALMYDQRGDYNSFADAMDALCDVQLENGLFHAATVDNLSTGIILPDGNEWLYGKDPHIAPAAWFIMSENGFVPYEFI